MRDEPTPKDALARLLRQAGPRPEAPRGAEERVKAVVRERWAQQVRSRRRKRVMAMVGSIAAMLVVAVALAARFAPGPVVGTVERTQGSVGVWTVGAPVQAGSEIRLSAGSGLAIRLSNGASLRVEGGARMLLKSGTDVVLNHGAVYLDSAGAATTVAIETPLGMARDVGTQFETRVTQGALRVRVREGAVELTSRDGESQLATVGEELRLESDGGWHRETIRPHSPDWSWASKLAPSFSLPGASLASFLDWAAREGGLNVTYDSVALEQESEAILLEGSVESLTPDEAVRAVLPTTGLRYTLIDGVLWIAKAGDSEGARQ